MLLGRLANHPHCAVRMAPQELLDPPYAGLLGSRGRAWSGTRPRHGERLELEPAAGRELSLTLMGVRAAPVSIAGVIQILPFHVERSEEGQVSRARRHSCHHIHMRGIVTSNGICIVASCAHSRSNGVHVSLGKRLARAGKLRARMTGSCVVVRRRPVVRSRSFACIDRCGLLRMLW
jgi:hypothetical protein